MKITNKDIDGDIIKFGYGDVLVTDRGIHIVVGKDDDGTEFNGYIVEECRVIGYATDEDDLLKMIRDNNLGKVIRVVNTENVEIVLG